MATTNYGALSDEALVHKELDLERQLLDLTFRHRTGQLEDTSKLGKIRKDIARARTAERARELVQGLNKDELRNRHRATFRPTPAEPSAPAAQQEAGGERRGFLQGLVDKIKGND